jgi:hypothetical protein
MSFWRPYCLLASLLLFVPAVKEGWGHGARNVYAKKDLRNLQLLPGDLNIPDIELVIEGRAR